MDNKIGIAVPEHAGGKSRSRRTIVDARVTVSLLHRLLFEWYAMHQRDLPWRRTRNPYRILVSEVMSQQTQILRVTEFYRRWLRRFPDLQTLAAARRSTVLREWSGLGYNSRALRLHELARTVVKEYGGKIPRDVHTLQQLPGIGKYTAYAVAGLAFGQNLPVVEVNVARIITRVTRSVAGADTKLPDGKAWETAAALLPSTRSNEWNQGLMDLGAEICRAVNPLCGRCPLQAHCASAFSPALRRRSTPRPRKEEPSINGVPRRIIRGFILKSLHSKNFTPINLRNLLPVKMTARELQAILSGMEKDGLVVRRSIKGILRICVAQ